MQKLWSFLACNYILYVPLLSWLAAQICKTIIDLILSGKLDLERMFGAGGMPSAHSALVCSMTIATARKFGVSSPFFAFAFILAAIVMYDAMGAVSYTHLDVYKRQVRSRRSCSAATPPG